MLDKIKAAALWVLGALAWLLLGWAFLLRDRLKAAQQQVAIDQAKQGIAKALDKVNQDKQESQDADAKFNELAADYAKSHPDGKS